ncbi:MAG: hypothetical protein K9K67_16070 [Bacteriovoracaceae bacterium]|nr:hypothetical protein [Bacteriovoracaceae bacterium]
MKSSLQILILLLLATTLGPVKLPLCSLVDDYVIMDLSIESDRYNNGYKEDRYDFVLDQFIAEFSPDISLKTGSFHILRDWGDGAVNAWAWRMGNEYWLEVPGGMARYHLIKETGFLSTLCHELGHLLGGTPHNDTISFEGQADYFSAMKCMERMLNRLSYKELLNAPIKCKGTYCGERFEGIESLSSYYAELEKRPTPSLNTPDRTITKRTLSRHPGSQCRFDTMVAALKCDNRDDFSYQDAFMGSCSLEGARPACWFNPEEFLVRN